VTGRFTRTGRVWTLAILLLTASLLVGSVAASAGAAGGGDARAVVAKKKCKKKKKGVKTAKKRKCKHKLSLPGPIVRATITWSSGEVDLHAFDASGNRSGIIQGCSTTNCPMAEGIPNATHSPDANNGGTEFFTDNIFVRGGRANREFGYAICFYNDASVSFTGVNALGQSQTIPVNGLSGEGHSVTLPTGPQVPANFAC
jgi:hypothetical protein